MGPRQVGKTTLVKSLIDENWKYITLDDQAQLELARTDPIGFIRNLTHKHVVIDEVQRLPELFVSIKQSVDEDRRPGRFLLTGSANALLLPRLSDSLAGRMEIILLTTLSECEINGIQPSFLDKVLSGRQPESQTTRIRDLLLERIVKGCFPEPLSRKKEHRSSAWYRHYIDTLIQSDIKDLTHIDHPARMTKLLKLCAFYTGKLINLSEMGQKLDLNRLTIQKYLGLLEQLFLVHRLNAWHHNEYKRLIKMPKLHMVDSGLICAIRGYTRDSLTQTPSDFGYLLESFVVNELCKQARYTLQPLEFFHYRDKDKVEVDLIIENVSGECFAIEVKASATLNQHDFKGLQKFKSIAGSRFKSGILLYDGDHSTAFGDNLFAVPIGALWTP